ALIQIGAQDERRLAANGTWQDIHGNSASIFRTLQAKYIRGKAERFREFNIQSPGIKNHAGLALVVFLQLSDPVGEVSLAGYDSPAEDLHIPPLKRRIKWEFRVHPGKVMRAKSAPSPCASSLPPESPASRMSARSPAAKTRRNPRAECESAGADRCAPIPTTLACSRDRSAAAILSPTGNIVRPAHLSPPAPRALPRSAA